MKASFGTKLFPLGGDQLARPWKCCHDLFHWVKSLKRSIFRWRWMRYLWTYTLLMPYLHFLLPFGILCLGWNVSKCKYSWITSFHGNTYQPLVFSIADTFTIIDTLFTCRSPMLSRDIFTAQFVKL